jgi:hypothetical protein
MNGCEQSDLKEHGDATGNPKACQNRNVEGDFQADR